MKGNSPRPIEEADLRNVLAVFTDVDGTLTTSDHSSTGSHKLGIKSARAERVSDFRGPALKSSTLKAIEKVKESGRAVVLVSGRPAGWGECWMRTLPVDGAIVENGGLFFARLEDGSIKKVFVQPKALRERNRQRLLREVRAAMKTVKGARLSTDSAHTEVDIAIDYNEEAKLGPTAADRLEELLRGKGVTVVRSSVHLNCWLGRFHKLSTVKRFIGQFFGTRLLPRDRRFIYVGDSFNDSEMFGAFSLSVGVANVAKILDQLEHTPAFVTHQPEGRGFEELVALLISHSVRK